MNTEINFLEKQPKKYIVPLVFGIIFLFLLAVVLVVLVYQQNQYVKSIEVDQHRVSQMEQSLREKNQQNATVEHFKELQGLISEIEYNHVPNVALYNAVLELLTSPNQLTSFTYSEGNQFTVEASFNQLEDVANYVGMLLDEIYIIDAELSNVYQAEENYQATLTFEVDVDSMREEFNHRE
ncbi:hypothetical protein GMD78_00385 [Ornithinibacillus sp. L9]|uniref:Tfp pilus assembly protein PilN n=1 Tax=Ornithinibacillus caprae TaxID=2678566 RepID=A0A6N8FHS1_9BACI|nr:hypothetical protein [Ornithinibacillus caprae]MUK86858.1 hypothetical protein [Ornithinibacillus caprae]